MACKLCATKPVWRFTNKSQLCSSCFAGYFEKKVKSTIRKYSMPIFQVKSDDLKAKIINSIISNLPQRKGKVSLQSLDEISSSVLQAMMHGSSSELKNLLPKNQPLYFVSDKEILLYAKIKRIKGVLGKESRKFSKIDDFLDSIAEKNPDIRHNIINALLKSH